MSKQKEAVMRWPLEREADGTIVVAEVRVTGHLTTLGLARLHQYIEIWDLAWFGSEKDIAGYSAGLVEREEINPEQEAGK